MHFVAGADILANDRRLLYRGLQVAHFDPYTGAATRPESGEAGRSLDTGRLTKKAEAEHRIGGYALRSADRDNARPSGARTRYRA